MRYQLMSFDILVNGVQRTFREEPTYEAAAVIKRKARGDIVDVLDRSTGLKVLMLEDGRTA